MALITVNEAATRTGYCTESIRNKIRAGILPAKKRGKRYVIEEADLDKLYQPLGRPLHVDMRSVLDS